MSTLARYRKPGGFKQLIVLVETSARAKRDQIMSIVTKENPHWASELNKRCLSMDKVLSWPVETVEKILQTIPEQTWPKALFHLEPDVRLKKFKELIQFHPIHKQTQLVDYFSSLKPSVGEIDAAHIHIYKKIREMQASGDFRPERIDPNLVMAGLERMVI